MDLGLNLPVLLVGLVPLVLLGAILVYAARVSQPGPPGPAGPPTGVAAMERKVAASTAMIAGMAILMGAYGLREPARQADATERQLDLSIARGITNYTTL